MKIVSSITFAIERAKRIGVLKYVERESRFGDTFVSIEDDVGLITVEDTQAQAEALVERIWTECHGSHV
jgi:hypothetical protein